MMDDVLGYSSQTGYCFDNEKMIRDEREGGEYGGGEERKEMGREVDIREPRGGRRAGNGRRGRSDPAGEAGVTVNQTGIK